jgi:hypothetical protein
MTKAQVQEFAIALVHHNYSFKNIKKYKPIRSNKGEALKRRNSPHHREMPFHPHCIEVIL